MKNTTMWYHTQVYGKICDIQKDAWVFPLHLGRLWLDSQNPRQSIHIACE